MKMRVKIYQLLEWADNRLHGPLTPVAVLVAALIGFTAPLWVPISWFLPDE